MRTTAQLLQSIVSKFGRDRAKSAPTYVTAPVHAEDLLPYDIEALNPYDPLVLEARAMFYALNPSVVTLTVISIDD